MIAASRSLTTSTIEGHVAELYKEGRCPEAPQLMGLTPAIRTEIRAINAGLRGDDVGKLKPVKERCTHSYAIIKLALA